MGEKRLILYGGGYVGKLWMEKLGDKKVYGFADSNQEKIGTDILGKAVFGIPQLIEMKKELAVFISTESNLKQEIYRMLEKNGLAECVVGYPDFQQEVYIHWNTYIDTETEFEGKNAVLSGARLGKSRLGYASYLSPNTHLYQAKVGKYSSIGPNVRIIQGQHPTKKFVSTHPIFYSTQQTIGKSYVDKNLFKEFRYTPDGYKLEIGNDVWIGDGATIMEGIVIADGTIIAAGANVTKNTMPYSIIGGNPAKQIRYRFAPEDIQFLLRLKWWDKDEEWICEHADCFDDIEKLKTELKKSGWAE